VETQAGKEKPAFSKASIYQKDAMEPEPESEELAEPETELAETNVAANKEDEEHCEDHCASASTKKYGFSKTQMDQELKAAQVSKKKNSSFATRPLVKLNYKKETQATVVAASDVGPDETK
jgi:K+/H+ antiporter YhaU regulatory subunit KhtT